MCAVKVGGSLIRYLSQKRVKSCSKLLLLLCKNCWTLGTHGEIWRLELASAEMTSERSVKGCTHSGGGREVNEDANLMELCFRDEMTGVAFLKMAAIAAE